VDSIQNLELKVIWFSMEKVAIHAGVHIRLLITAPLQIHLNQNDIKSKHFNCLFVHCMPLFVHYCRPVPVRRRPPSTGPRMGKTSSMFL